REAANVRFGSKAELCGATRYVRFAPKSDIDCVFRHVCFRPIVDMLLFDRADLAVSAKSFVGSIANLRSCGSTKGRKSCRQLISPQADIALSTASFNIRRASPHFRAIASRECAS